MATFRSRLALNRDIVLVFAAIVFPVYSWSVLQILRLFPSWILRLSLWELVGIIAYTQAYALLESLLILIALVLLSAVLPARFFRKNFVAQGSLLVFLTAGWVIATHHNNQFFPREIRVFLLWSAIYLVSVGVSFILIRRYERLDQIVNSLVERLTVFLYVYLPISLAAVIIVILRNI